MSDPRTIPVIVSYARTPIGRFLGGLAKLQAPQLGAIAIKEAVNRASIDPGAVQDVIMGNVLQGGVGQAPARQAAIGAGIPATIPAVTINKVCGSGLKSVMLAAQSIKAGDQEVVVAGRTTDQLPGGHLVWAAPTVPLFGLGALLLNKTDRNLHADQVATIEAQAVPPACYSCHPSHLLSPHVEGGE